MHEPRRNQCQLPAASRATRLALRSAAHAFAAFLLCAPGVCAQSPPDRLVELRPSPGQTFSLWEDGQADQPLLYPVARGGSGRALLGTFRLGAVILGREGAHEEPLPTIVRASDGATLVDLGELDFGSRAGLDFTFAVALNGSLDLQLRYFGVDRFRATAAAHDDGGVRFEGFGLALIAPAQWVDYDSTLHSFEVGIRPRVIEAIPLVLGFRTVQVHEGFRVGTDEAMLLARLATRTNNFLYGFQLGTEPTLWGAGKPLRLEGTAKAGIYGNRARQSTFWEGLDNPVSRGRDRPSFVGELGLSVAWKLHRFFTVRGGYELVWVHGLALAPEQSVAVDLAEPQPAIFASGNSLYQGAVATLEFVF